MPGLASARCARLLLAATLTVLISRDALAAVYYLRQTVGDDANDGLSPQTAWKTLRKLWSLRAGDTAYVGPGLYRDVVQLANGGTPEARITFIADNDGKYTGDPPGRVMISGSEPVDESSFLPTSSKGVYSLRVTGYEVLGVVEMDSAQFRYFRARSTKEHLVDKLTEMQVVEKLPSHYYFDKGSRTLYIHTSDGRSPRTHEIELIRRGFGFYLGPKHYVTVIGFTFRHMGDAGINFFKGGGDGAALFNTSYGSRQGIRAYTASNVLVYGNTLFRNENSGVYFLGGSVNCSAIRNVTYENVKGIRWGSDSNNSVTIENVAFDNLEHGISIERVKSATVRANRLGRNHESQLFVLGAEYTSDENCFERRGPDDFITDFFPLPWAHRFKSLREYVETRHQDLGSRENNCGPWPEKLDVHKMHEEAMSYRERALKTLESEAPQPTPTPAGRSSRPENSRNMPLSGAVANREATGR
jgi:hypothetical protein